MRSSLLKLAKNIFARGSLQSVKFSYSTQDIISISNIVAVSAHEVLCDRHPILLDGNFKQFLDCFSVAVLAGVCAKMADSIDTTTFNNWFSTELSQTLRARSQDLPELMTDYVNAEIHFRDAFHKIPELTAEQALWGASGTWLLINLLGDKGRNCPDVAMAVGYLILFDVDEVFKTIQS
jgi:hypothetical protein